jgi:hypothetical protein
MEYSDSNDAFTTIYLKICCRISLNIAVNMVVASLKDEFLPCKALALFLQVK